MAEHAPSELPIIARIEEAETVVALNVEKVTSAIRASMGADPQPAPAPGDLSCIPPVITGAFAEDSVNRVAFNICIALQGLIGDAGASILGLLEGAASGINNVLAEVEALVGGITQEIVDTLNGVVQTVTETLERSLESIVRTAESVVSSIAEVVGDIIGRLDRAIDTLLNAVGFAVGTLINSISDAFASLLAGASAIVERIDKTVRQVGEFLVTMAEDTLEAMSRSIAAVLGPLIGAGQSVLGRLADIVESVPGALKDAGGALVEGIGDFVGDPLGKLGTIFVTQVEGFFATLIEEGNLSHGEILRTLLTRLGAPAEVVEKIASAADAATPSTPSWTAAALSFLIPLIIAQFVSAAMDPVAQQLGQEISSATKQSLITPADLLDGLFKGDIPESRFATDFEQAGFTEERITQLIATFRNAPDVNVHIQAWLRELISEGELDAVLAANRMRPDDAALLKQVVFFVPPAQDLIRMAVREVFSPDVRARFGQDEDFPEEFATFAAQQGITEEWAKAYWAAHWSLPSPAQGFEMLHRKVIEPDDLNVLLRALDVMPFWREKMTDIAFSPLTRVDLRRMHALGLLTDADIQTRYEAIGFNEDDAALMVAFTVAFNFSEDTLPEELDGLTRASVLGMFDDGIIPRDDAVGLLTSMGIGEDAAELFVEQRELNRDRTERRDLIESIVALAGGGRMSLPVAQDSLAQIGLTAVEITRAIGRILSSRDKRDRLPTLADLRKMLESDIIDDEVFLDTLKASGFDDTWAGREFELITGREAE